MAVQTNTFSTFQSKGIRESLSDVISRVAMEETPFISNAGKESASNTFFEWQTQDLAAVDLNNAALEGDEQAYSAVTPTVRLGNYTQIMRKTFIVSETAEVVNKAGRSSEVAYQKVLKGLEIRRDAEAILLSNQAASAGDATTNPRKTASLLAFIKTNTSIGAGGANPTYTNIPTGTRTDGTQRAFTEAQVKDVAAQMYRNGAKLDMIMVGPVNKQKFSTFAGIAQLRTETNKKAATIVGAADLYVSDFGVVSIVPNAFMRERDALFIDTSKVSVATLRPYKCEEMAKNSDARRFLCLAEWGLRVENERAMGGVFDLTTTLA
jgi:hypothetical protein